MVEILEKYGGWPVVKGDWDSEKWDWMEAYHNISNDGLDDTAIFSLNILTDQRNSSKRVLDVNMPLIYSQKCKKSDCLKCELSLVAA